MPSKRPRPEAVAQPERNYEVSVIWEQGATGQAHAGGKPPIEIATYGGAERQPNTWSPEGLLACSVAGCLLNTVLLLAGRDGIEIRCYMSNATVTTDGPSADCELTGVAVEIAVTLADKAHEKALRGIMERATKACPFSTSLRCPIKVQLHIHAAA
ncbi:MAG: hypothetical protein EOM20_21430 [Spartobacteria bacterium]|nr:hypothetical protein [Spartobacteria bacterium]